jgi:hypothetical protein
LVGKRGDFRGLSQKTRSNIYFRRVYYITIVVYYGTTHQEPIYLLPLTKSNTYILYIKRTNQLNQTGRCRAWLTAKIKPLGLIGCLITKQTSKQTSKRGLFISKSAISRCLFSNIILLPLYRSLPYHSVCSHHTASAVLNSDNSSGATINRYLNKE